MERFVYLCVMLLLCPLTTAARAQQVTVDHVFVFVERNAPEADALRSAGFFVAPDTSHHTGQGTASICVMLRNAYVELIWVEVPEDFATVGFGMPERQMAARGSPFGVGLRRGGDGADLPFETAPYRPDWIGALPPIEMAEWSGAVEQPLIFVVPDPMRWDVILPQVPQFEPYTEHERGVRELSAVRLEGPGPLGQSPAARALAQLGVVEFGATDVHVMHLTFDAGSRGEIIDLRPVLPIVLHF